MPYEICSLKSNFHVVRETCSQRAGQKFSPLCLGNAVGSTNPINTCRDVDTIQRWTVTDERVRERGKGEREREEGERGRVRERERESE